MDIEKQAIAIIPARYHSTRLPGKPLCDIAGKSLIHRVWESAAQSKKLREIIVATDDERIAEECFNIGASFVMTPSALPSGTDRVHYAYRELNEFADIVINLQGDEPLISGELLDNLVDSMIETKAEVGTLIKKIESVEEIFNPNVVKVVTNSKQQAMYFSRHPIPFVREVEQSEWLNNSIFWKHIGIYAFQPRSLWKFVHFTPTDLEVAEKLEQLRLLQNSVPITCFQTNIDLIGIDTPADLQKSIEYFSKQQIK